jgi:hypothetical protein
MTITHEVLLVVRFYSRVTLRVSYKKRELLTLREHLSSPPVYGVVYVANLFSFLQCHIMCLHSGFRVVMSVTISTLERYSICL